MHASEEFRYQTRALAVQKMLRSALFNYIKTEPRDKELAIREYNKIATLGEKRWTR